MVNIIKYKSIYYLISGTAVILSIVALSFWGLKLGIDFKGGSLLEIEFAKKTLEKNEILEKIKSIDLGNIVITPSENNRMILKFKNIDEKTHQEILSAMGPDIKELSFESIGPTIGQELREKAFYAIILVLILIGLYIAYVFRKVSYPVASWVYGIIALITLLHDILIPMGVFSYLGKFYNVEMNTAFIAALLTILGYSINDTIVIFDRIRENLLKSYKGDFEEVVNRSLNETFVRSLNASLTTLFAIGAVYFFGGASIRYFSLALLIGLASGAYSSIFVAAPLLITWRNKFNK